MATVEISLALLLAITLVGAIAKWVPLPQPILLVLGGVAISFLPGMAALRIDPEIFFLLLIPPLLFGDGWLIPKRDLLAVLRPVLLLAFGLVFLTVVAVGYLMHWLIPALPLAAAFALGAIVSPTDAVAVAAVTSRLPLPDRVTHIVNGESLINDASGLVAFKFAVAAMATGMFSWADAAGEFVVLSGGGSVMGLAIAWLVGEARVRLARFCVDDPTIQTLLSLLTPYAAYLAAESLHVSGILSVVAAGLYAGAHDTRHVSLATRRHAWEVWSMVLFIGNGLVFLLLGAQLRPVVAALHRESSAELAGYALALVALLIALRLLWVYPAAYVPHLLSRRVRSREGRRDPGHVFLVGWAGIRGSVTMAAALSIPLSTASGEAFPGRDLIIFLAATTIVLTLVVNGLTLPSFIRLLGVRGDRRAEQEERAARLATAQAAIDALQREASRLSDPDRVAAVQGLLARYGQRLARHSANAGRRADLEAQEHDERRLALVALAAEQAELQSLRDTGVINDQTLRLLQVDLDHAEAMLRGAPRESH